MKTKTWLPIFPGFYNTIFEPDNEDDEIYEINRIRAEKGLPNITYDDCEFNYKEYEQNIAEQCTELIETELRELGLVKSIKYESLRSPKFYNYSNDSIDIEVTLTNKHIGNIKRYLTNNMPAFKDYLKNRYTSCDGFISSYPNYTEGWIDFAEHAHKLGSVLNFILSNEEYDDLQLYYGLIDNYIFCTNYDELTE